MPNNVTGDEQKARTPSPQPGQARPIVVTPADGDDLNADSVLQDFETLADYAAYSQIVVPNWLPGLSYSAETAAGAAPGYSALVHSGPGTGKCYPTYSALLLPGSISTPHYPLNWLIKIILGGVVGVATFQLSRDGGASFGAVQTTAALYFDLDFSSVLLAFSGTFTAGDTYKFSGGIVPRQTFQDGGGAGKFMIDHNGLPTRRFTQIAQDWVSLQEQGGNTPVALGGSFPQDFDGGRWQFDGTASVGSYLAYPVPTTDSIMGGLALKLTGSGTNGQKTYARARGLVTNRLGPIVIEFMISQLTNAANGTFLIGLFGDFTTMSSSLAGRRCWLKKAAGDTNWMWKPGDLAEVDTGVPPAAANAWIKVRMEVHTSGPLRTAFNKNVMLLFLDDVLIAIAVDMLFGDPGYGLGIGIETTNTAAAPALLISPVTCTIGMPGVNEQVV